MAEKTINGVTISVDGNGYMTDINQWTKELAVELAKEVEINELTDKHWEVINFIQETFKKDVPLSIRKVGKSGITNIKEFYALFPEGPLKKASYISGIPKPASCV